MSDTLNDIFANLQQFIVAPLNAFGIAGYVFDAAGESVANLSADITDHYTEENRALQDHIAIRPIRITLKGYVGELVYTQPENTPTSFQTVTQKLTQISEYLPSLSAAATQLEQAIEVPQGIKLSSENLNSAANIYGLVQNFLSANGNQARQQNAYSYFKSLMQQGILLAIQTPWSFMTNMAVESIHAVQGENSIFITDFAVTFKQIRIARAATGAYTFNTITQATAAPLQSLGQIQISDLLPIPRLSPIAAIQAAPITQQGIVPGQTLPNLALPGAQANMIDGGSLSSDPGVQPVFLYDDTGEVP